MNLLFTQSNLVRSGYVCVLSFFLFIPFTIHAATNLVLNPSLEDANASNTAPLNWQKEQWGNLTASFQYATSGFDGTRSAYIKVTQYQSGDAKWFFDPVAVSPNTEYTFTGYYKANTQSRVVVRSLDANGVATYIQLAATVPASASTWKKVTYKFKTLPNTNKVTVLHLIRKVGWLQIDSASLTSGTTTPVFDFSLQNGGGKTVTRGQSTTNTVTATLVSGATQNVAFTVTGLPSGSTGSFSNTSCNPTCSSVLTIGTTATTATGTFPVTVTGTSGTTTRTTTFNVTVNAAGQPAFDFSLANGGSRSVTQGQSATNSITASLVAGATEGVTFTTTGLPANTTATYNTPSCNPTCSTTLTIGTSTSTPAGTYPVTVSATNGSLNRTTTFNLTINELPPTGTNYVPNPSVEIVSPSNSTLPQGWSHASWGTNQPTYTYMNEGYTGSRSVKVTMNSISSGDAKWVFTPQPLPTGKDYRFTAWYKTNTVPHVVAQYIMPDGSESFFGLSDPLPGANAATTWQPYSGIFSVPTGVTAVSVFFFLTNVGWVQTDEYRIEPYVPTGFNRPLVSITFDDGHEENVTTALPVLNQYGFKTTHCFATQYIEGNPGQVANVNAFSTTGHEICSHSVTHPDLTTLNAAQLDYEISHPKTYLASITGQPISGFATPYGAYNATVLNALGQYYDVHRTVDEGYNTKDSLNVMKLRVQNMTPQVTLAQFKEWVNKAKADKTWLILVYHRVAATNPEAYDTPKADFDQQMAWLSTQNVTIATMRDAAVETQAQ